MVIGIVLIAYSLGAMVDIAIDLMTCVNVTPLWHFLQWWALQFVYAVIVVGTLAYCIWQGNSLWCMFFHYVCRRCCFGFVRCVAFDLDLAVVS